MNVKHVLRIGVFTGRITIFVFLFVTTGTVVKHFGAAVSAKH
jgi:hypothetical protein